LEEIVNKLLRAADECKRTSQSFETDPVLTMCNELDAAVAEIAKAWSGSWAGYHASVYLEGFRTSQPGEVFDLEWGPIPSRLNRTRGNWREYSYDDVLAEIQDRAQVSDLSPIQCAAQAAGEAFKKQKEEIVPALDALLALHDDPPLKDLRERIGGLETHTSRQDFIRAIAPRQIMSRDSLAVTQGIRTPHHINFMALLLEYRSFGEQCAELAGLATHAARYVQQKRRIEREEREMERQGKKIFIGHGRSHIWKDLKDFLQDRLNLEWDEFSREPVPGLTTKERLNTMLNEARFAFLIMTAEDEHSDKTKHARENVIHEAGLFQGRLGFEKAIILLEEECAEFSNIQGIQQIRFPPGNIRAVFEEIRRVLEREKVLSG
jgi:predicted nucleotide-binding protein